MMPNRVGQQLGNYRLIRWLGKGGFAHVYQGEHVRLNTKAAIKVLHTQLAEADRDSFLTEARMIANLEHPHIVRVLDFDVEEGSPFLVMSYAPNGTLRQYHPKGTQLSLPAIVSYVKQLASALQYAHDEKLIHRDVKPENMLMGRRNEVLLSDFGIALVSQSSRYQSMQDVIGTVAYMSPEQIQGKPRPSSDQYSLAIVVYEWLCGDRPFHGSFTELCAQHMFALPAPLRQKVPTLPSDVEQVVLTALAKDPKQRFASLQVFAAAFEQASQARQEHISTGLPQPPFQPFALSPQTLSQQAPPIILPASDSLSPAFSLSQEVPITPIPIEFAQASRPELYTPLPEANRPLSPTLPARQLPTLLPLKWSPHLGRPSWYKAILLMVLALLIAGSTGLIYNAVNYYHAHMQLDAATNEYNAFVTSNGMMFGFDAAHTHFNPYEKVLTSSNVSRLTQGWTYPSVGVISTAPAIANGIVYVGSVDKSLYAFDAHSGSKLWNFQTQGAISTTESPVVVDGVIYFGSQDHTLYALDAHSGTKLWSFSTRGGIYSSPSVVNGVVYIGTGDYALYALDARTGTKLWSFSTRGGIYCSPAVVDGVVYISSNDDELYALDARTGTKLWSFSTGAVIGTSPAIANGVVYIGSYDDSLYALNAQTGTKLWSFSTRSEIQSSPVVVNGIVYFGSWDGSFYALNARSGNKIWNYATGSGITVSPAVVNNIVYFGTRSSDSALYALDARTGTKLWRLTFGSGVFASIISGGIIQSPTVVNGIIYLSYRGLVSLDAYTGKKLKSFSTGGAIYSSPVVVNGVIYFGSEDHSFYALDANSGSKQWSFATGDIIETSPAIVSGIVYMDSTDGTFYALNARTGTKLWRFSTGNTGNAGGTSPAVFRGIIYFGLDKSLYALDARTGTKLWSFATGDGIYAPPAVVNGVVYFGSYDKSLYALDAHTGTKLWSFATGGIIDTSPAVVNGVVYFGSSDKSLYALDAYTGTKLWSFATADVIDTSPTVANGVVYFGSNDQSLYALDTHSGTKLWSFATGDYITYASVVANGVVYFGSWKGKLYALDAHTGTKLWSFVTGAAIHSSPAIVNGVVYIGSNDGKLYSFHL